MLNHSCESVFILHHTVTLMPSFNLHQLICSPSGGSLFLAQTFLIQLPQFHVTPLEWMHNPAGKSPKPFIWYRAGEICHNTRLYQRSTFESPDGKSHESKVTLRASGKDCCTTPPGSRIRSAWFNCWCQFFRCLDVILFLSLSLEPWCWDCFFIIIVIIWRGRDGCVVLFLLFHDVALLLCDEGTRQSFRGRGRGTGGASQWGTRTRLNVSCLYSGSRATGVLARGLPVDFLSHAQIPSHSLARMLAHRWCGGK